MSKITIGDKVAYNGKSKAIKKELTDLTVLKTISDGEPFPNSKEMNLSGKTLVIVRDEKTKIDFWFPEDELVPVVDRLQKTYQEAEKTYKEALLGKIKNILRNLSPNKPHHRLDVEEYYMEGEYNRICKYCTPKDFPSNFCLQSFNLDDGKLSVTGVDLDSDGEWEFSEYDFGVDELEEIADLVEAVAESVENGEYGVEDNETLTTA